MPRNLPEKPPKLFNKGDKIEVRKHNADAAAAAYIWYPATFLRSTAQQFYVRFDTLSEFEDDPTSPLHREYVSAEDVRPAPSSELHRYFKVGEIMEGLCREKKGWRKGTVVDILENSRYAVSFESDGNGNGTRISPAEMEQWEVRTFRKWVDGLWHPPLRLEHVLQNKSDELKENSRGLVLRIKCSRNASAIKNFNKGMLVEVKSDDDGFRGSWFTAVIVKSLGNNKFMVEYRTLRTDDKTEFLKEEVDFSCIRPCPPVVQQVLPFSYLEKVDAWYNDGWWEGHIVEVFNGCKYTVHFMHTEEEMVFEHCKLRPHQHWVDCKWFAASKVNLSNDHLKSGKVNLKRKRFGKVAGPLFRDGMMVEVKSDEEGYQGSWYTAVIVSCLPCDHYLVEYQTLKTEDESELLREKAFASYIRPCPSKIVGVNHFELLEEVDAWYNDGWWVGLVSKVLDGLKYAVYFWTTNEELIFEHYSLRPHQEWIGGQWVATYRKKSKLLVKNNLGKSQGVDDGNGAESNFMNGAKVEVKYDEHGSRGIWYPAAIVKSLGNRKYMVEYLTLESDDGTQLHKQETDVLCMRPCPPVVQRKEPFKLCELVDAWYNGAWWVGQICNVLEGRRYSVYSDTTKETLEFQHSELRPHLNWVNGQWVAAKRVGQKSC